MRGRARVGVGARNHTHAQYKNYSPFTNAYATLNRTSILLRVAFEYGHTACAFCTSASASFFSTPGRDTFNSTSRPKPWGMGPMPTVAATVASCGNATFWREATSFSALRKQAEYPAANNCSGL